ncbi:c-type cytochrome [Tepidiphilus olei]|uniref:c-type cytochrome n=1 Tax=Tepidiphilus olei TaxID=2502184 RepID=UPI00115E5A31|nr:c-type cytochrome [Tepidiphilus olei]
MLKRSIVLTALAASSLLHAAEPVAPEQVQEIVTTLCASCHGPDGNTPLMPEYPKLAGQHPEYLYKQLLDFKAWDDKPPARENATMNAMVMAYSKEEMLGLSQYFAQQTLQPAEPKAQETLALGQRIWHHGLPDKAVPACSGCHGNNGAGIPSLYPRLSGQTPDYVVLQLKAFREQQRANDPEQMMRQIANKLTDTEIEALADYAASLR